MYAHKTKSVYVVEIDYGCGFEPVFETDSKKFAQIEKSHYLKNNDFGNRVRVKKYRIKIIGNKTYYV